MPLVALLSDIHSNFSALQAVIADTHYVRATEIVCIGDIVGYGPRPEQCLNTIRKMAAVCVQGNHDWAVTHSDKKVRMNPLAATGVEFSRQQLKDEQLQWLAKLPLMKKHRGFTLVHSSLHHPDRWPYIFDDFEAAASLKKQETSTCFIGHTHRPDIFALKQKSNPKEIAPLRFQLPPKGRHLINVGSVGQPRNEDPRAQYVLYDTTKRIVEFRRVPYDIERTVKQINEARLPEELGLRLLVGM